MTKDWGLHFCWYFYFHFLVFFFFKRPMEFFFLSLHHVKAKWKKTKTKPSILSFCLFALVYQITLASCISWNRGCESWEMEGLSLAANDLPTSLFLVKAVSFLPILGSFNVQSLWIQDFSLAWSWEYVVGAGAERVVSGAGQLSWWLGKEDGCQRLSLGPLKSGKQHTWGLGTTFGRKWPTLVSLPGSQ